jgi:hypothetical protein
MKKTILISIFTFVSIFTQAQNKKIFTDFYNLTDSLKTVKSTVEDFATEMKNEWKNDSLKIIGQKKYIEVSGVLDGITASFSTVILHPKQLNATIKTKITKQLQNLYLKMNDFSSFYVDSKLFMTNGAKFGPGTITVITTLFDAGTKLYDMIKKFVIAQRTEIANKFKDDCSLVKWDKLPKSE